MTSGNKTQSLIERGRFEMSEAAFDDTVKGISEQSILSFDLKTIVPEMFVKTDIVSRTLARLCCKACDDVLEQYRGAYTSPRGCLVRLYFWSSPICWATG